MELVDRIVENATPHLDKGEKVVAAFPAQTMNQVIGLVPMLAVLVLAISRDLTPQTEIILFLIALVPVIGYLIRNKNVTVIATNQRTLVGESGTFNMLQVKSILHEAPADVKLGPTEGRSHKTEALGMRLYVQRRFHDQVDLADGRAS